MAEKKIRQMQDLETIRRNKAISLEQIAQATKIASHYLKAIEAGEFEKLPGGVYSISYLRQYARAIDYEESELVDYYRSIMPASEPEPFAANNSDPPKKRFPKVFGIAIPPLRL